LSQNIASGASTQINQPVQHPDHIFSAKTRADLNGKRFPCEHIHDGQQADPIAIRQLVMNKIHAPGLVQPGGLTAGFPMYRHLAPAGPFCP
jgi:hypothetical protein